MKKIITFIIIAAVIVFGILYGLSWIPESINLTLNGEITNGTTQEITKETLTVKGEMYTPWFSGGMFKGTVSCENIGLSAEFDGKNTSATINENYYHISCGIGMKLTGSVNEYTSDTGDRHEIVTISVHRKNYVYTTATWFTNLHEHSLQTSYFFIPEQ